MLNTHSKPMICFVYSFLEHPQGGIGQYELQLTERLRSVDEIYLQTSRIVPLKLPFRIPRLFGVDLNAFLKNNPMWFDVPKSHKFTVHLSHQFMGLAIPFIKLRGFISGFKPNIIITVHDLFDQETHWNPMLKHLKPNWRWSDRLSNFLMIKSIGLADQIIVDSHATMGSVVKVLPRSKDKISVVHLGWSVPSVIGKASTRKSNQVLYVGSLHPRKNIQTLVKAVTILRKTGHDVKLILAGAPRITHKVDEIQNVDGVEILGEVTFEEIRRLYATSTVFALPSLSEGFGLPLIEAMGYGCPVIASDIPVFREIAQDSAIFVAPQDEMRWADAIRLLLEREQERAALAERGLALAYKFKWEKTLVETLAVYGLQQDN